MYLQTSNLGGLRQEDGCELEITLGYTGRYCLNNKSLVIFKSLFYNTELYLLLLLLCKIKVAYVPRLGSKVDLRRAAEYFEIPFLN